MALIAMGANLSSPVGPPVETLQSAVKLLAEMGVRPRKISRFFATPCFPAGAGPDYVNAVISTHWDGEPRELLEILHEVEATFARQRTERWGQRTLDLDLLAVGAKIAPNHEVQGTWRRISLDKQKSTVPEELILPHPRIQDRAFVLVPLMDISPDWRHPLIDLDVRAMCAALPEEARKEVVAL